MADQTLWARSNGLKSLDENRQVPVKYSLSLSLDKADLDPGVNPFAPDIEVNCEKVGRARLKQGLDETLRLQFRGRSHHSGNQIIEFEDVERAHRLVYLENGQKFWSNPISDDAAEVAAPAPLEQFWATMGRVSPEPRIRAR